MKKEYNFHTLELSDEECDIWYASDDYHKLLNGKFRKIIDGPSGLKNKYLNADDEVQMNYGEKFQNLISLGKFKGHGIFLSKEEALRCQKDFLYAKKNQIDEKLASINRELNENTIDNKKLTEQQVALTLYDRNLLSASTLLEKFGIDPEEEALKLSNERDTIFDRDNAEMRRQLRLEESKAVIRMQESLLSRKKT